MPGLAFSMAAGTVLVSAAVVAAEPATITCASQGERVECDADTSKGVALVRKTGTADCVLGTTWGTREGAIWVSNGCAAEFALGQATFEQAKTEKIEQWGSIQPGNGFLVGRTSLGELYLSAYGLVRYLNQMPPGQTWVDHNGQTHDVLARNDIFAHRIMVFLKGWIGLPKFIYQFTLWTVNTTDQKNLFVTIGYQFHRVFSLYGGLNALPGTRTLLGSHPYWLGHDRVMADEFFRPFFTNGIWASGEPLPGLWYSAMIGNNLSALGITATQLTRSMAYSGSVWWMPTTHEFGPNGGFDDWEWHDELATRFGICGTLSHESRFSDAATGTPENTTMRLADSLNVFDPGAVAPGVTVQEVRYRMVEADAGIKYKGIFVGTAFFQRWLDDFETDAQDPTGTIVDKGFYVQAAFYPVKHKLELYGVTSWVFGDDDWGFKTSHEYIAGTNWFWASTRDFRINGQLIWVDRSPVSSVFGYYTGGQKGPTISLGASLMF
jgi:hypothetical protein